MTPIDPKSLRAAFGSYMTGVTVVTAKDAQGGFAGFTANSFTSVSLNPPLLLVCPGNHLSSFDVFRAASHFAVHILAENQEGLSNLFASSKTDRFAQCKWDLDAFGTPVLADVAAHFSCSTSQVIPAGDHVVLIGQVQAYEHRSSKGLGYASSGYFTLGRHEDIAPVDAIARKAFVGAIVEHDGHVFVQETEAGLSVPMLPVNAAQDAPAALKSGLARAGINAEIRQVYSVYHDPNRGEHFTIYRVSAKTQANTGQGRFVKIDALDADQMSQPAQCAMMHRFKSEFNNKQFGLFIGDTVSGNVHSAGSP